MFDQRNQNKKTALRIGAAAAGALLAIAVIAPALPGASSSATDVAGAQIVPAQAQTAQAATQKKAKKVSITVGGKRYQVKLNNTKTAQNFAASLPKTYDMDTLYGAIKYHEIDPGIRANKLKSYKQIKAGEVLMCEYDCIVVAYKNYSSSTRYVKIGKIKNVKGLAKRCASDTVQMKFGR